MQQPQASHGLNLQPLYVVFALLVILLTFLLTRKLRKAPHVIVFVGPSDSGKTALFTKLVFNKHKKSVTSVKENQASLDSLNLKLIDLPGAERLWSRHWAQFREKASTVVFVVDSTNVPSKVQSIGGHLQNILEDSRVRKKELRLVIACNKQDLPGAKGRSEIKTILEKELISLSRISSSPNSPEVSFDKLEVKMIETSFNCADQIIKSAL